MLELPEDDAPPEEMWHHDEQLGEWFEAVKWRRQHPNEHSIDDDDDDEKYMTNTAFRVAKRRR